MPKEKLVSITKDQRELLARIQADPGMKVIKSSVALASLVRKGFITTLDGGFGERERTGLGRVSAPRLVMATITNAGADRLNPRRAGVAALPPGAKKPITAPELNRLILETAKSKDSRARIMYAQAERHGENSEEAKLWEAKFGEAEDELFSLIGMVKSAAKRDKLIKKYGLGWKVS